MKDGKAMVIAVVACALLAASLYAGELYPPPGPVEPTGRFGPRTEINDANTPGDANSLFKITEPGSYYLAGNHTGEAGKHGIHIIAHNVTLDLNGFTLFGVEDSQYGVRVVEGYNNIVVKNGCARDWGVSGIEMGSSLCCQATDLRSINNGVDGIHVGRGVVTRCAVRGNGFRGISVGRGSSVSHCTAESNGGYGFLTSPSVTLLNCGAYANTGHGFRVNSGCVVTSCTAWENGGDGINAAEAGGGAEGCTVAGCAVRENGGAGIRACNSLIHGNTSGNNGGPAIDGCGSSTEVDNHEY